jgi:diguanylate cyclase (GGDEF)-like protein/PAS domain S-box-containing protein
MLSSIFFSYQSSLERIDDEGRQAVNDILAETAFFVTYTAANAETPEIQRMVANLALIDEVDEVLLLDADKRINFASNFASIGRDASDVLEKDKLSFLDMNPGSMRPTVERHHERLWAKATIAVPNAIHHADYTVFIRYNLSGKLNRALGEAYDQALPVFLFSLLTLLLLLAFLNLFITKPLSRLNALVALIKSGQDEIQNPLKGHGELAQVGAALATAGKQIRDDYKQIQDRENRLSVTLNSIGDGVIVCDYRARIVSINPMAETLLDCDASLAVTQAVDDVFKARSVESQQTVKPVHEVLSSGEETYLHNNTLLQTKHKQIQISYSAAPIYEDRVIVGVILVFRDVSREYQLKSKLKQNVHFLENLIQISPSVTFVLKQDEAGQYEFSYISESIQRYSSLDYQHWLDSRHLWKSFIHPDDVPTLVKTCRQAIIRQGEIQTCQFRFNGNKEQYLTFRVNLVAINEVTTGGDTLELVGVATDITEQVSVAQNNLFLGNILERSLNEIYIFDKDSLHFIQVNYGARKNLGYTSSELQALTPLELKRDMKRTEFEKLISPLKSGQKTYIDFETVHYRKDDTSYPVDVSLQLDELDHKPCFVALIRDISEQKQNESEINFLAFHDTLTRLPNRTLFDERLSQAISLCERNREEFSLLFIDLDRFKIINDTLGHDIGDELLKVVAKRMTDVVRDVDTVSRSGGDEFSIILMQTDSSGAVHVADKLLEVIAKPVVINGNSLYVTASIGISIYPSNGTLGSELMKMADNAMYRAKDTKANSYHFYTESMHINMQYRMELERQLRGAIDKNQFTMLYQPQLELSSGKIIATEALIRWNHCSLGIVSPAEFIPVAEESGLIGEIGDWVLQAVISQVASWQRESEASFTTAINVSANQFRDDRLLEKISVLLSEYDVDPAKIEIEITESTAMEDMEHTRLQMQKLAKAGIGLSMDDFGTGFSSLNSLKKFPFKKLKIDKSFIDDLLKDEDDLAIVDAIITLAQKLSLTTIAEGVETAAQRELLAERGCDAIQGYLFSKPVSPDTVLALVEQSSANEKPAS